MLHHSLLYIAKEEHAPKLKNLIRAKRMERDLQLRRHKTLSHKNCVFAFNLVLKKLARLPSL